MTVPNILYGKKFAVQLRQPHAAKQQFSYVRLFAYKHFEAMPIITQHFSYFNQIHLYYIHFFEKICQKISNFPLYYFSIMDYTHI